MPISLVVANNVHRGTFDDVQELNFDKMSGSFLEKSWSVSSKNIKIALLK